MEDRILSIEQAAEETPWSKTTLYRVAPQSDSPFHKRGGRWVTTESDLLGWVRTGPKPQREANSESPMPRRPRERGNFLAEVVDLRKRSA